MEAKNSQSHSEFLLSLRQSALSSKKSAEAMKSEDALFEELMSDPPDFRWMERMMAEVRLYALDLIVEKAALSGEAAQALRLFVAERQVARQQVRDLATVLNLCLSNSIPANDESFAILLAEYEAALDTERTRSQAAVEALDAVLGWKSKPRLKAALLQVGLVGDAMHLWQIDISPSGMHLSEIACEWDENKTLPPQFDWLLRQES